MSYEVAEIRFGSCRVYWGSHGCTRDRGHAGYHWCCCECVVHPDPSEGCVGTWPYYGIGPRGAHFYGEDATAE